MVTKLYKLTNQQDKTRAGESNETQWGEGVTHEASGQGVLCTDGIIHAYRDPLVALFLNPAHANIKEPLLWEAKGKVTHEEACKCGVRKLTTVKKIPLPTITLEAKVRFAIACGLEVYKDESFRKWAFEWLDGKDRSDVAANAAANAAYNAAANAATNAAANAAYAAAHAAYAAAHAAADAAYAATNAARAATNTFTSQTLINICNWAVTDKPL
jgi:hypothetical protein